MLVRFAAPGSGEMGLLVLLRPGSLLPEVLELRLVVVASVALALAGRDSSEFVSPSLLLGTGHLDALRAGVRGDAAVIQGILRDTKGKTNTYGKDI